MMCLSPKTVFCLQNGLFSFSDAFGFPFTWVIPYLSMATGLPTRILGNEGRHGRRGEPLFRRADSRFGDVSAVLSEDSRCHARSSARPPRLL